MLPGYVNGYRLIIFKILFKYELIIRDQTGNPLTFCYIVYKKSQ